MRLVLMEFKVTIWGQPRTLAHAEEAMLQRKGQRSNGASE